MAAKEPRLQKQPAGTYGMADIRHLARMLSQYDLSEVEVEHLGQRIRLRRERTASAQPVAVASAQLVPLVPAVTQVKAEQVDADDGSALITSPFVGTFYRAPGPEAAAFVEVGQTVKKGQVLCIVEAMKLMNEIEADTTCKVVEILQSNGEPVEFGQPLFKVLPLA
jgi:acetyl-CoA carboxylase biotin carboxyl carrier protein